ncbi:MAG: glutamine synthetase family protein [Xanthobacteraceae bacterium]|uniref:glutamine synthetase family protein n=1 Tax=Pseudolabrys sp. TaxID=1960880 RepID=UPI003D12870B
MAGFIEKHGLWSNDQRRAADEIKARVKADGLKLFRMAWADPHGASRAKTVTVPAFLGALENGYNINVATTTLDASGARTFASFTRGGGMGLDEMTGSPNLILVPDPATFRVLPWEPQVGWILCDEYFISGVPFHFSPRRLLKNQIAALEQAGMRSLIGLEVEWYLLRLAEEHLTEEHVGRPGLKGHAIRTYPAEPGFSFHSETNMDLMHPLLAQIADALEKLGLPLRSIENEWGPGQVECTFAPKDALTAADNLVLFRTATRQLCRRNGYLATFMPRPALKGYYPSGWHLHQSLVDARSGDNLFTPRNGSALSPLGQHYLGGLMHHGIAATVLASPTINGYRRFRVNSLAPDRVAWGTDHRGVMLRVLAAAGDPASRIENRIGEPSANPYLYIASQLVTGRDGIANKRDPGQPETDPYTSQRPMLPKSLTDALHHFEKELLFAEQFGKVFVDYYAKIKRTELGRYETYLKDNNIDPAGEEPTAWEQDEYFDFF